MSSSINLSKGNKIELKKADGSSLTKIMMGLGWDEAKKGGLFSRSSSSGSIDLDASVGMFSENKELIDTVSFRKLMSSDGSVRHSGDNLTGAGDGDDETIHVDLQGIPERVKSLVFTVNSFRGQTFNEVDNCFSRLVDTVTGQEISIFKLAEKGSHTGLIMCKVYRHNGGWKLGAIGATCSGRVFSDIVPDILPHL